MNELIIIGQKVIEMLKANIESRIDDKGEKFQPYSFDYWFWKYKRKKFRGKPSKSPLKFLKFREESRQEYESKKDLVDLRLTGEMIASLDVLVADSSSDTKRIVIGSNTRDGAFKLYYHNLGGAGRGRVVRRFFYLNAKQQQEIADYAAALVKGEVQVRANIMDFLDLE